MTFLKPTRRQLLGAGVLGTVTVLGVPTSLTSCASSASSGSSGETFRNPKVKASEGGRLTGVVTAKRSQIDIGIGHDYSTYTFDGVIPGATWEVHPGDTIGVTLRNAMPVLSEDDQARSDGHGHGQMDTGSTGDFVNMTRPHDWTHTNLHTHGLHVSPEDTEVGAGDNPFVTIVPGAEQRYEIPIPSDHTGGLFWYHPHRHGAVAYQVQGGMAGALIVRGEIDRVPEIAAATEQVMVFQALEMMDDFEIPAPEPNATLQEAFFPRDRIVWTLNGQNTPVITMRRGEVQRWRMLNAAEGKLMSLRLTGHSMHHIGYDGLALPAPRMMRDTFIEPGARVEALVKAQFPGRYELILSPATSQLPYLPGWNQALGADQPVGSDGTVWQEVVPRVVAIVDVLPDKVDMELPRTLPAYNPPLRPIVKHRDVEYTVHRRDDHQFEAFGINHRPFNPDDPPYVMRVDTAEEWTIHNAADEGFVHVFHIHVNPFLVTHVNGERLQTPVWRDTWALGPNLGDSFTFVMNLDDFTGKTVEHCHILTHEDLGMMEALEILP
ncbi:MAG: multicopper oxidase domain-containing protein [Leucobacter sp.]|nr:multicopper oxidase domain-containing protein [Leucobacter sp.]